MTKEAAELKTQMQRIVSILRALDDTEKSCCGVTLAQGHALVEIGDAGALSLIDLSGKMSLDKSTLSRTVNNLVVQGYCVREEQPDDRRYVVIRLTPQGDELYTKIKEALDAYFEDIYQAIPAGKRSEVMQSVDLLLRAINDSVCCCMEDQD